MSYDLQNFYKSTLSLDWSIGTGTFYVTTKPTISTGWLVISPNNGNTREIVKYTSTGTDANGDYVVVSVRGVGGTTEQTHTVGEPIRMNITAEYWDAMNDDIAAIVASGVSNANTTTMGGVEEATAAEIDSGAQTGSTGAELFINPKLLNDAHNIPLVVPGTAGNVMSSNGTDWASVTFASLTPTPVFQQLLPTQDTSNQPSSGVYQSGSNTDGSVMYVYETATSFKRYARDTNTGMYYVTHIIDPVVTLSGVASRVGSIIQIGTFIYLFYSDGTNIKATRFLAADLTGEVNMTVPVVASSSWTVAWTDGTFAFVVSSGTTTTCRKWSVSGTTFSAVDTSTCQNFAPVIGTHHSTFYDGTTVYVFSDSNLGTTGYVITKLSDIRAAAFTSTTIKSNGVSIVYGDNPGGAISAPAGTNKMYIGFFIPVYNATAQYTVNMMLIPFTKP